MAQQSLGGKLLTWAVILGIAILIAWWRHSGATPAPAPEPGNGFETGRPLAEPPPPPPEPPVLKERSPLHWYFGPPHKPRELATVLIDNGLSEAVTVTLAPQVSVTVPGAAQGEVQMLTGERSLAVSGGTAAPLTIACAGEEGALYIVNPGAAWDYRFERREYSTMAISLGGGRPATVLAGMPFLSIGHIDYLFADFPETIEVHTFGGYAEVSRTQLTHAKTEAAARPITTVEKDGTAIWVVATGEAAWTVTTAQTGTQMARVFIDPDHETLVIKAGEQPLFTVDQTMAQVQFTPGAWSLTAARGETAGANRAALTGLKAVLADKRYLWSPTGTPVYAIDYQMYGPVFGNAGETPGTERLEGLTFTLIPTTLAFEEFPTSIKTGALGMTRLVSRFDRDPFANSTGVTEQLAQAYDKALAAARTAAGKQVEAVDALAAEWTPPRDCLQLWTLAAVKAEFEADAEIDEGVAPDWKSVNAEYEAVARFEPAWPQLYVRQGLCLMRTKEWRAAKEALEKAVALNPALEKQLAPQMAACQQGMDQPEPAAAAQP